MSMELMVKAMKIRVGNPLRKLVLINWLIMPAIRVSAGPATSILLTSARLANVL